MEISRTAAINLPAALCRIVALRWMYESLHHDDGNHESELATLKGQYRDALWQVIQYRPPEKEIEGLGYYAGILLRFDRICWEEDELILHLLEYGSL